MAKQRKLDRITEDEVILSVLFDASRQVESLHAQILVLRDELKKVSQRLDGARHMLGDGLNKKVAYAAMLQVSAVSRIVGLDNVVPPSLESVS